MRNSVTQYAKSGDVHIAYQITGTGPIDLVWVPGFVTHLELAWDAPATVHMIERLGSFARLIRFDKRGTGMSDRVAVATLEERMDDVRAVMDAAGSARAALFGMSEGGPMSLLFAATYPERTTALVLYAAFAKRLWSPDYPIGVSGLDRRAYVDLIERQWAGEADLSIVAPSLAHDPKFKERFTMLRRMSASPGAAVALARMTTEIDVRPILSAIHVPTLILHRVPDRDVAVENGRYLATHIAGARYKEFPDGDHWLTTGDTGVLLDDIEEFLTGVRRGPDVDRVLTTILFTDIVGSTEHAAKLGDHRWRELHAAHHALVRRELDRFRGREVDTAGDGFLAMFDGPARAIRCAVAIRDVVTQLGIDVRAGLHTGEVEVSHDGVTGLAVHIGARVMSMAGPGEVLVSSTVKDLVAGAGIDFEDRGTHALRGAPGEWRLFMVRC
jgi:class 3 adenylate cyclase/alpha-beta hydrolase superfamily lysophospholipase